jgi:hypothetical protein
MTLFAAALSIAAVLTVAVAASGPIASATAKSRPVANHKKHKRVTPASTLSGTWNGQYSGAFSGTFVLRWTQSGSSLSGTIAISSPASSLRVNGTLNGSTITFGTVGSTAITYTGTVSGKSMSGSFKTPEGGGSWSASES